MALAGSLSRAFCQLQAFRSLLPSASCYLQPASERNYQRMGDRLVLSSLISLKDVLQRGIKKQANEIRVGNVLEVKGRLLQVTKQQYSQGQGRQRGNVQVEVKDLRTGAKSQERWRPYDMVEAARLDSRRYQFLYEEDDVVHLMDPSSFEQATVDRSLFGDSHMYLVEGLQVNLNFHEDTPLSGEVPIQITASVASADAYTRGDNASVGMKGAVLQSGAAVKVPPYIQPGEEIVVDTRTGEFVRRVTG